MKKLRIVRLEKSEEGLIGILLIDGKVDCFTLQPDENDVHFSIPVGNYLCKRFHGKKWIDTFEILVKGHTSLLFHALNTEDQSEGCIGLGETVGYLGSKRAIFSSGKAFFDFMSKLKDETELNLVIVDCF